MSAKAPPDRPPLTPAFAWTYLALNLLALPGLGTRLAGRRGGLSQIAMAALGCALLLVWAMRFLGRWILEARPAWDDPPWSWMGAAGLALSLASWGWGLASGLAFLREARASAERPPPVPRA
jgi:hypothetical protein